MVNYKLLGASLLASSLGFSGLALAEGTSTSTPNQPSNAGIYVEGQAGYNFISGDSAYKNTINSFVNNQANASTKSTGGSFAARAAVGYQFNPYIAIETGFAYLGYTKYTGTVRNLTATGKTTSLAFDLAAKGILPLGLISPALYHANLFVKGGAALVGTKATFTNIDGVVTGNSSYKYNVAPELGAGAGYAFNNSVGVDVSYMHIFGAHQVAAGNAASSAIVIAPVASTKFVPTSNMILAGISYRFAV